ncbi:hypothetical protein H4R19_004421 [Coemansia spiralis]|nr:hypothetical protein H4R19_004421 [Coemansia spiralis]
MQCSDISRRQQRLLFQCYCKRVYNTRFYNTYPTDDRIVCTRNDKDNYDAQMSMICENYKQYDSCDGVNISAAATATPALSVTKVAVLAILLTTLFGY